MVLYAAPLVTMAITTNYIGSLRQFRDDRETNVMLPFRKAQKNKSIRIDSVAANEFCRLQAGHLLAATVLLGP